MSQGDKPKICPNGCVLCEQLGFNHKVMMNYPKEESILTLESCQHDVAMSRDFLLSFH